MCGYHVFMLHILIFGDARGGTLKQYCVGVITRQAHLSGVAKSCQLMSLHAAIITTLTGCCQQAGAFQR